jgi:hypothetical protein
MRIRLILSVILISCGIIFSQVETTKLGSEITLSEKTKISDILSSPESYLDKIVLIEGEVLDVCSHMGCWMELKSDVEGGKIKIKVKDGEIVFPVEAKGNAALVEGKVYKIELTKEEAVEYFEHFAEESGKEFDPSIIAGPMTIYQIKGLGAEIYMNREG